MTETQAREKVQTLFFDMDGTLVDTEGAAARVVEKVFQEWGMTILQEDAEAVLGKKWEVAFDHVFKKYKAPIPRAEAEALILDRYRKGLAEHLIEVPGAVSAVKALAKGYRMALVSGSYREEILWILAKLGIDHHFEVILGAEDYPQSKPAPDGYLLGLRKMKADPKSSLVLEDSRAGIESAHRAGMKVVAIRCTNRFGQDQSKADFSIEDLRELSPQWIQSQVDKA
jgi:HAD superfamily hydrolase (TIGR01509 family)